MLPYIKAVYTPSMSVEDIVNASYKLYADEILDLKSLEESIVSKITKNSKNLISLSAYHFAMYFIFLDSSAKKMNSQLFIKNECNT